MSYAFQYNLTVVYFFGVFVFSGVFLLLPFFVSRGEVFLSKGSAYECGVEPFGFYSQFFNIQYFLVAVLFLVFDLELLYLLPWAVTAQKCASVFGVIYFFPFYRFVVLLIFGYIFE